jgi:biotin carboxylase
LPRIALVGSRNAARKAARRLGYDPVVLHVAARAEQAVGAYGGTADDAVDRSREHFGDERPDAVVAVAEGAVPTAAALRAAFGLAGLSPEAAARCHDKRAMKHAAAAAGIPCAPFVSIDDGTTAAELVDTLGLPVVLKLPVGQHVGEVVVTAGDAETCANQLDAARALVDIELA